MRKKVDNSPFLLLEAVQRAEAWAKDTNNVVVSLRQEVMATRIQMVEIAQRLRGATLWILLLTGGLFVNILLRIVWSK